MNILIPNWTWYPSGGDWTYVENLNKFYTARGHRVIPFSMHDERNFETEYKRYFIEKIDYKELNKSKSLPNALKSAKKTLYSAEAKKNITRLLDENHVDLVHINNIHHYLTPASILPVIKKRNIPVIWTLHDYVILCPNTTFVSKEQVCEKCFKTKYYSCVVNKCKKDSRAASMMAAAESYVNHFLNPYKHVDYFVCPSAFIKQKFEQFGFRSEQLVHIYNLFDTAEITEQSIQPAKRERDYLIYVGRIQRVKGILTLARAMKSKHVDLIVLGDGEERQELESLVQSEGLDNVKVLGKKPKKEVFELVSGSLFMVVPSEWYENLPYSVVEALAMEKPVLGANIGGIPELVLDGKTGYLFEPGNAADLSQKIDLMLSDRPLLTQMGRQAREHALKMVNYDSFGTALSGVFSSLGLNL